MFDVAQQAADQQQTRSPAPSKDLDSGSSESGSSTSKPSNAAGDKSAQEAAAFGEKLAKEAAKGKPKTQARSKIEGPKPKPAKKPKPLPKKAAPTPAKVKHKGGELKGAGPAPAPKPVEGKKQTSSQGTKQATKGLTQAKPTDYSKKIKTAGDDIGKAGQKEADAANKALPTFKAVMPGEGTATGGKKIEKVAGDKNVDKGIKGADGKAPKMAKDKPVAGKKDKPGSKSVSKAKKDTPPDVMKKIFGSALKTVDTQSGVNTNPGPAPKTEYGGKSDPVRAPKQDDSADTNMDDALKKNAKAIDDGPGPEQVQREELEAQFDAKAFKQKSAKSPSENKDMSHFMATGHPTGVYDKADTIMKPEFSAHLKKADKEFDKAVDKRDKDRDKAVDDTSKKVEAENQKAQESQEKEVLKARKDVDKQQKKTKEKQGKELDKAKKKSDKERKRVEKDVSKKKKDTDKKVDGEFTKGKKKAEGEKKKTEAKAKAEKKKAEEKKKNQSWWERAASAVGSFLDSVCSLIGDLFDGLSKLVAGVLNAVKDAACGLIDAAVSFACKALDALGDFLKKAVTALLGSVFPELAAKLNEYIDKAVNAAKSAVKAVGEGLKKAVTAALDALNAVIQKVLEVYKAAIQMALTVAAAVVTGDWEKALKALLEGGLKIAGIAPATFYKFVGDSMDTIKKIVDKPGKFIGNLIDALGKGFTQFKDNFVTHLMTGVVDWLTGQISDVGLKLPDKWDAGGIFDLVMQVAGITKDKIKKKIEKKVGKKAMRVIEHVWGFVEAAINGGLAGLWDHLKEQIGNLWDMAIDGIKGYLMEKIVVAAVTKIASMFNPVGALVQVIITAWNIYQFVQEQAQKIMALVKAVVDSITQIVEGQLSPAANWIEKALGKLIPIGISLLANLLGLGGIAKKVKEIIGGFQEKIDKGLDKLIDTLWAQAKKLFKGDEDGKGEAEAKSGDKPARTISRLKGVTLATTAGSYDLGWVAKEGSDFPKLESKGSNKGKLGAKVLPDLKKKIAASDDGAGKKKAEGKLKLVQGSVMSAEGKANAYLTKEPDNAKEIDTVVQNLGANMLEVANYVGDLTVGEKGKPNAYPKAINFTEKDGDKHKFWIENKGGQPVPMSASVEKNAEERIALWRPLYAKLREEDKADVDGLYAAVKSADAALRSSARRIDDPSTPADPATLTVPQQKAADSIKKVWDFYDAHIVPDAEILERAKKFELKLGINLAKEPLAVESSSKMIKKALKYLETKAKVLTDSDDDAETKLNELIMSCGKDAPTYAGTVDKDLATLKKVFGGGGNIRENMQHVTHWVENVLNGDMIGENMEPRFKEIAKQAGLNMSALTGELKKLVKDKAEAEGIDPKDVDLSTLNDWSDLGKMSGSIIVRLQDDSRAPETNPDGSRLGPDKKASQMTVGSFRAMGGRLSKTEASRIREEGGKKYVPWTEGQRSWRIKLESEFARVAELANIPLKAAPSGSTLRLMRSNSLLKAVAPTHARLACLGFMMPISAHSFHEVMLAAGQYGAAYGGDCNYRKVSPLSEAKMRKLGGGKFPDEP